MLTASVPQFAFRYNVRSPLHSFLGRAPSPTQAGAARTRLRLALETGPAFIDDGVGPRPRVPSVGSGGLRLVQDWLVDDRTLGFRLGKEFFGFFYWRFVAGER